MRHWNKANSVADLGNLMADWLEGRIDSRPAYYEPGPGPEEETTGLIPTLAACNRAGYVTTDSQPGLHARAYNGQRLVQRAAVAGFVADPGLLSRLTRAAELHDLAVVVDGLRDDRRRGGIAVTTIGGHDVTGFGDMMPRRDLRANWATVPRRAVDQLVAAHQVAIVDPTWGPSDRLWQMLDQVAGRRR